MVSGTQLAGLACSISQIVQKNEKSELFFHKAYSQKGASRCSGDSEISLPYSVVGREHGLCIVSFFFFNTAVSFTLSTPGKA